MSDLTSFLDNMIASRKRENAPLPHPAPIRLTGSSDNALEFTSLEALLSVGDAPEVRQLNNAEIRSLSGDWLPADFLWALLALRLFETQV